MSGWNPRDTDVIMYGVASTPMPDFDFAPASRAVIEAIQRLTPKAEEYTDPIVKAAAELASAMTAQGLAAHTERVAEQKRDTLRAQEHAAQATYEEAVGAHKVATARAQAARAALVALAAGEAPTDG